MKKSLLIQAMLIGVVGVFAQNIPFPKSSSFKGCIKPNHIKESEMNASVASFYDYWKTQYLKHDLKALPGGYYVAGDATGSTDGVSGAIYKELGTSEGQGYGMIITALMAGYNQNAQVEFDGLFKSARAFYSSNNNALMGWIVADSSSALGDFDSATDGDMDIAYALLLADKQWGSGGAVNYLQEAKNMINNGLKASYISNSKRLTLGDWQAKSSPNSRPSDWMMGHLKAFEVATGDVIWKEVADTLYSLTAQIQKTYSPQTGLLPDFVVENPVKPAAPRFLESDNDGDYYYNAARVPLRFIMDYAHNGNPNALLSVNKMVSWMRTKTLDKPTAIKAGYTLAGANVAGGAYFTTVFAAPIIAASVGQPENQAFLNAGWDAIKNTKENYFEDSINLLSMLFISGNWWSPNGSSSPVLTSKTELSQMNIVRLNQDQIQLMGENESEFEVGIWSAVSGEKIQSFGRLKSGDLIQLEKLGTGVYLLGMKGQNVNSFHKVIKW